MSVDTWPWNVDVPPSSLHVGNTVQIKVAEDDNEQQQQQQQQKKTFTVSKDMLTSISPFFKAAFTGRFRESEEQSLELCTVKIETFQYFIGWLDRSIRLLGSQAYNLNHFEGPLFINQEDISESGEYVFDILIDLYIFADAYDIRRLRNHSIDRIYERLAARRAPVTILDLLKPDTVEYIYEVTSESSALRRLIIDVCAARLPLLFYARKQEQGARPDVNTYPKPFTLDIKKSRTFQKICHDSVGMSAVEYNANDTQGILAALADASTKPRHKLPYVCNYQERERHEHRCPSELHGHEFEEHWWHNWLIDWREIQQMRRSENVVSFFRDPGRSITAARPKGKREKQRAEYGEAP